MLPHIVYPSVCMYVCVSVTLMHPANAVRWNEMPYGTDTCVVPSNVVLDRGTGPPKEREIRLHADIIIMRENIFVYISSET